MNSVNEKRKGWRKKLLHELIDYLSAVLYMAVFFGLFFNFQRLLLAHYDITYTEYGISVIKALVLAKVVLVAEALRLGRGYQDKPLVVPTLYKTLLFTLCVALFSMAEELVRGLIHGMGPMGAVHEVINQFNYEWLARALVTFFAFIPYFMVKELGKVLGEGTIVRLFFRRRSATKTGLDRAQNTSVK